MVPIKLLPGKFSPKERRHYLHVCTRNQYKESMCNELLTSMEHCSIECFFSNNSLIGCPIVAERLSRNKVLFFGSRQA